MVSLLHQDIQRLNPLGIGEGFEHQAAQKYP